LQLSPWQLAVKKKPQSKPQHQWLLQLQRQKLRHQQLTQLLLLLHQLLLLTQLLLPPSNTSLLDKKAALLSGFFSSRFCEVTALLPQALT
jgi:hypothetical protein